MRRARYVAVTVVAASACVASYASLHESAIVVNPEGYSFGDVEVGDVATSTLTISPTGSNETVVAVQLASSCPDFSIDPGELPAAVYTDCTRSPCTLVPHRFTAAFAPRFGGTQACLVRIDHVADDGTTARTEHVTLAGAGVPPAYALEVMPAVIDFGDVPSGSSYSHAVTLTNRGAKSLTVSGAISSWFSVTGGKLDPHTLAAGASETFNVTCTVGEGSAATSVLTLSSSEGPTAAIDLSCRAGSANVAISPGIVRFAPTLVGRPADRSVVISAGSSQGGAQIVSNFRFAPETSSDLVFAAPPPASSSLGSNGSLTVTLRNAATQPVAGPLGTLAFDVDGIERHVAVAADVRLGSIGAEPPSANLGPVCAGGSSSRAIELYANADGDVLVTGVVTPPAPFAASMVRGVLEARRKNALVLTASVEAPAAGDHAGELVVETNSPTQPTLAIPVRATALPPGIAGVPDVLRFGVVPIRTTAPAQEIVIANCTEDNVDVIGARIEGRDRGDFAVVSQLRPVTLAPNAQERVLVVMTPQAQGPRSAELVIEHAGGVTAIALDGHGSIEGLRDRESYYGCAIGTPGRGSVCVLLAVLISCAPRRSRRSRII